MNKKTNHKGNSESFITIFLQIQEIDFHINRITIILCTHKVDVEKCNTIALQKHFPTLEIYQVKMDTNATNIKHIQPWLNNKSFNHIHTIAVGALVMFTDNINIQKGVVNGTTATITFMIFDTKNNVIDIEVQLTTNSLKKVLKKHTFQNKYTYVGYYYKASFPITLAYVTIKHNHKAQQLAQKLLLI